MNVGFTFRHLDATDGLKSAIHEKLPKLATFLSDSADIKIIFETEGINHRVEANVHDAGIHTSIHAETDDMYKSIASMFDKLERHLRRQKEKKKSHR